MDKAKFINEKINKDFYGYLPKTYQEKLDNIILQHGCDDDFLSKWNMYKDHVLSVNIEAVKDPSEIFENENVTHSLVMEEFTIDELMEMCKQEITRYNYFENQLAHEGVAHDENPPGRGSGRYPFGSGKNPYQHTTVGDFNAYVNQMMKKGLTEVEIAEGLNISTTTLRNIKRIDKNKFRRAIVEYAKKRDSEGVSREQIAAEIREKFHTDKYKGESSVRSLLNEDSERKMDISLKTADELKRILDEQPGGMLEVGLGVEAEIGITRGKLDEALKSLELDGYNIYTRRVPQATNKGKLTTLKILAKPDVEWKEVYQSDKIGHLSEYTSPDNGDHIFKYKYPESMDSSRLMVRFAEDGGTAKDGLVEIRRNVKDLSLGESNYAQVRILVDDKYYIKGMAVYGNDNDFPDGVDVIFNSNKPRSKGKLGALKSVDENLKKDPNNPFGSSIKSGINYPDNYIHGGQSYYLDDNGEYKLSLINKRSDEGDWGEWSKELPSQMLSKQPQKTIERQLNLAKASKEEEYEEILEVTHPTIRKQLLQEFADKCDRAAVDLKAAPFPEQKYQVILPLKTIKDDECYAPNYADGQELALIRYPHGGTFEIPIVKVNNRNKEGIETITPSAADAVGINANTAHRLSGADFDGDTVMVIPLKPESFKIQTHDELEGLKNFDPSVEYGPDPDMPIETDSDGNEYAYRNGIKYRVMSEGYKQRQMGIVSNLITDMTLAGAPDDELAAAVRHSMVVIDAAKHKLDYRASAEANNISALHKKYQSRIDPVTGREKQGAATIISRASGPKDIPERKEGAYVAKDTGNILTLIDEEKKLYIDEKTGQVYTQKEKLTRRIDPVTGKKLYRNTNNVFYVVEYKDSSGKKQKARIVEKDGEMFYKNKETDEYTKVSTEKVIKKDVMIKSTQMAEVDDAFELSSGKPQEVAYALYANKMKSMANEARKEMLMTKDNPYSPSAAKVYKKEVDELNYEYNEALKNKPKEKHAQLIADSLLKEYMKEDPHMDEEHKTRLATRLLNEARENVGAHRREILLTDKQWAAIQAGAISASRLKEIFKMVNKERLRQLATPYKTKDSLSKAQISRLKTLSKKGYTNQEIAKVLGISSSTVNKYLLGKED